MALCTIKNNFRQGPNPEYKLLCFIQLTKFFCKEEKALAFNRDRCCHLVLCLRLILFHCRHQQSIRNVVLSVILLSEVMLRGILLGGIMPGI